MHKIAKTLCSICLIALVGTAVLAGPRTHRGNPHRYVPGALDGPLVEATSLDGVTWAAWAYRSGAEYDVALAFRTNGAWSEPVFVGAFDGADQRQPALAVDRRGNFYLAFADDASGQIRLSTLRAGTEEWTDPLTLGTSDRADLPRLRIVRERLVVAFRTKDAIDVADLPLVVANGIIDGPDPVERPGDEDDTDEWSWPQDNEDGRRETPRLDN